MKSFPRIVDSSGEFSEACPCPAAQKELHQVHRQVAVRAITNSGNPDALLDENGIPILDEATGGLIIDNYPHTLVS